MDKILLKYTEDAEPKQSLTNTDIIEVKIKTNLITFFNFIYNIKLNLHILAFEKEICKTRFGSTK